MRLDYSNVALKSITLWHFSLLPRRPPYLPTNNSMRSFSHMGNLYKNDAKAARAVRARRRSNKMETMTPNKGTPTVRVKTPMSAQGMKSPAKEEVKAAAAPPSFFSELFGACVGESTATTPTLRRIPSDFLQCGRDGAPNSPVSKGKDLFDMINTPEHS